MLFYFYDRRFNSIKVRLKLHYYIAQSFRRLFQFHKGTIKTMRKIGKKERLYQFQFHKGTIKSCGCWT